MRAKYPIQPLRYCFNLFIRSFMGIDNFLEVISLIRFFTLFTVCLASKTFGFFFDFVKLKPRNVLFQGRSYFDFS
ncbi:hypothetical protein SRABI133_02885 [Peribacillus simplex]|uniref:Uncharacterized protein n=1 Tax=Peribacillus simplex TaxID=1478 RepID=A0A9W4L1P4_9BACI|nr:hypothetical protein SRABI133_02885 [Peribacillus simplex]